MISMKQQVWGGEGENEKLGKMERCKMRREIREGEVMEEVGVSHTGQFMMMVCVCITVSSEN